MANKKDIQAWLDSMAQGNIPDHRLEAWAMELDSIVGLINDHRVAQATMRVSELAVEIRRNKRSAIEERLGNGG